jgi:hypothetical protein
MIYKDYSIETADDARNKKIGLNGKGSIPTVLTGMYTSELEARKAIDLYKESFKSKVKSNASKQSNG